MRQRRAVDLLYTSCGSRTPSLAWLPSSCMCTAGIPACLSSLIRPSSLWEGPVQTARRANRPTGKITVNHIAIFFAMLDFVYSTVNPSSPPAGSRYISAPLIRRLWPCTLALLRPTRASILEPTCVARYAHGIRYQQRATPGVVAASRK